MRIPSTIELQDETIDGLTRQYNHGQQTNVLRHDNPYLDMVFAMWVPCVASYAGAGVLQPSSIILMVEWHDDDENFRRRNGIHHARCLGVEGHNQGIPYRSVSDVTVHRSRSNTGN